MIMTATRRWVSQDGAKAGREAGEMERAADAAVTMK